MGRVDLILNIVSKMYRLNLNPTNFWPKPNQKSIGKPKFSINRSGSTCVGRSYGENSPISFGLGSTWQAKHYNRLHPNLSNNILFSSETPTNNALEKKKFGSTQTQTYQVRLRLG